jgi:hypothetical protein
MCTSTSGPRRERGVNGQIGPIEAEGDRPACTRAKRREGWGYRLDRQAERLRGDGLALAQRGDALPSNRTAMAVPRMMPANGRPHR